MLRVVDDGNLNVVTGQSPPDKDGSSTAVKADQTLTIAHVSSLQ